MILLIDNYDSFSYNLVQLAGTINPAIEVRRCDKISIEEIKELNPSHIILSPGPGYPKDAGICEEAVRTFNGKIPILGVCLGHQAICEAFGAKIAPAKHLMHGRQSDVHVAGGSAVFHGLPPLIKVGRYHSLAACRNTLPDDLLVIAEDIDCEVMAVKHRDADTYGLQFHPESILTPEGARMMENFLELGGGTCD